ncbi:hypothetical protein HY642_06765 [Candidatus Woesearchaeota archaeon]|nr:hypothetical protein [Candidatus Woesearchaeota archaeon]
MEHLCNYRLAPPVTKSINELRCELGTLLRDAAREGMRSECRDAINYNIHSLGADNDDMIIEGNGRQYAVLEFVNFREFYVRDSYRLAMTTEWVTGVLDKHPEVCQRSR